MKKWAQRSGYFLFWSWNCIFVAFIYFGVLPTTGPDLFGGLLDHTIHFDFILFFAVVLCMPPLAILAAWLHFRKHPQALVKILYGIELPLLLLSLFRIFFLRECTAGVIHILLIFFVGSIFLLLALFQGRKSINRWIMLSGTSILLWCGLWIFLFLIFFIPPSGWSILSAAIELIIHFFQNIWNIEFSKLFNPSAFFFGGLGILLFFFTATLFLFLPCAYVYFSWSTWHANWRVFPAGKQQLAAALLSGLILFTNSGFFLLVNSQHHVETFEKLTKIDGSISEKKELLRSRKEIRTGLIHIYLAPYRYMGEWQKADSLQSLYAQTFKVRKQSVRWIQELFNQAARPLLYRGTGSGMSADQKEAERLYREFFDAPIQEAERDAIRHAIQATYSREQRDAGLINIDQQVVHLTEQQVNIVEQGEWADLEIKESYTNSSLQPEEVFYHFSLPEGAVVTGLWLSDTDEKKYACRIAPRGAAQKVYKEIVGRGSDPALLEQVGPRMYRLRIFPIPPANRRNTKQDSKMHMWLSIRMLRQSDTKWELPKLSEKRNIYWDNKTVYRYNGQKEKKASSWLPKSLPAKTAFHARKHFSTVGNHLITATPRNKETTKSVSLVTIAVLLDTSYSMGSCRDALNNLAQQLKNPPQNMRFDYYFVDSAIHELASFTPATLDSILFFGTLDTKKVLNSFFSSSHGQNYDHLIVVTDKTLFTEKEREDDNTLLNSPTWFLLVDGHSPRVTEDDVMQKLYATGGGIANDLPSLFGDIKAYQQIQSDTTLIGIDQHYLWKITENKQSNGDDQDFAIFSASKLIHHFLTNNQNEPLDNLDSIHNIAVQHRIVTPLSSMIVLVNNAQKELLAQAEGKEDRFERETETGKEMLTTPHAPLEVSAVPEPEEWLLLIVVLGFLSNHLYRRKIYCIPKF